jgi:hypothetical protein
MTQDELRILLREVWEQSGADFSGIGVIVCDNAKGLPIISLRDDAPITEGSVADILANVSQCASRFHDGFHIINGTGKLTHVAQYFSPPIVREAGFDRRRVVGGRFVAALFGSAIPGVLMTGIVGVKSGLSIFSNGEEVIYEELI